MNPVTPINLQRTALKPWCCAMDSKAKTPLAEPRADVMVKTASGNPVWWASHMSAIEPPILAVPSQLSSQEKSTFRLTYCCRAEESYKEPQDVEASCILDQGRAHNE